MHKMHFCYESLYENQFRFLGIPTPGRRKFFREFLRTSAMKDEGELHAVLKELWNNSGREYQYCAIEILMDFKKLWSINQSKSSSIVSIIKAGGTRSTLYLMIVLAVILRSILLHKLT